MHLGPSEQETELADRARLPHAGVEGVVHWPSEKTLASERVTVISASYYLVRKQCYTGEKLLWES